ncbi:MAG: RluA family pseudouridine synthase [Prolixibacteraceae bacterium]|nr:RluA family pseudouridine synthase [Prolixibacteraceae bacterium]MBN2650093.1 RluA family pseudouridine synthase [Prolixibacteraceae bacterium]
MINHQQIELAEKHTVPPLNKAQRLSDYLPGIFTSISTRKGIKKAIKKGLVKIDGKTGNTGDWVKGGENIELYKEAGINKNLLVDIPIHVFYEDDDLAVVRKPAGIAVSGNKRRTLEHALPHNLHMSPKSDALPIPQAIHRLDYPTSGVLLVGKTTAAVIALNQLFEQHKIEKKYLAVCIGEMPQCGTIETPVDHKAAKTTYQVLETVKSERFGCLNLLEVKIETGRRHQIRKHLTENGNPILGDQTYGTEGKILKGKGLYLHAISLKFTHPTRNDEIEIKDDVPDKFKKIFTVFPE